MSDFPTLKEAMATADDFIKQNRELFRENVDFDKYPDVTHETNPLCEKFYYVWDVRTQGASGSMVVLRCGWVKIGVVSGMRNRCELGGWVGGGGQRFLDSIFVCKC